MGDDSREIFRSDNVAIRSVPGVDPTRWVITFDHHSIGLGLDRPGFAETFLKEQGVSAIHVLGRGYHWYQYPDILKAASVVRDATAGAVRRVAYGSSMGGYAAVRFADAVGADAVLALSPQYSIDPSVVPWEQRWAEDGRRIVWLPELKGPLRCRCVPVLIFDPQGPDLRHAELIASDVPCTIIHAPYAGHPVTTYLGEVGLLRKVLLELLTDSHVPANTAAEIRRQRRRSSVYLGNLAEQQPSWRLTTGMEIARRAAAMGGGSILGMLSLGRLLTRAGDHEQAALLYSDICLRTDREPAYLVPYADALRASGQLKAAIAVANDVITALPAWPFLRNWIASMQAEDGNVGEAVRHQKIAVKLDRTNTYYKEVLRRYESSLRKRKFATLINRLKSRL